MARKTVSFSKTGIENLPEDKAVVYKIITSSGSNNYTGAAKRGEVKSSLMRHLPGGKAAVPGAKVIVEQVDSISAARLKEQSTIRRAEPKYNMTKKAAPKKASAKKAAPKKAVAKKAVAKKAAAKKPVQKRAAQGRR